MDRDGSKVQFGCCMDNPLFQYLNTASATIALVKKPLGSHQLLLKEGQKGPVVGRVSRQCLSQEQQD